MKMIKKVAINIVTIFSFLNFRRNEYVCKLIDTIHDERIIIIQVTKFRSYLRLFTCKNRHSIGETVNYSESHIEGGDIQFCMFKVLCDCVIIINTRIKFY